MSSNKTKIRDLQPNLKPDHKSRKPLYLLDFLRSYFFTLDINAKHLTCAVKGCFYLQAEIIRTIILYCLQVK